MIMNKIPEFLKEEYPFKQNSFDIGDGNKINYVDEGEGDVVVMLHGNPTWSFYYRNLIKNLRSAFRCIAIDHIGCGLSDKPQNYKYCLANHIQNAQKLLEHLKLKRFHLVMHDWGCAIGVPLAERWPERVESLVIMNGAAFTSKLIPWRINICRIPILGDILIRGLNLFVLGSNMMSTAKGLSDLAAAGYKLPYDSWKNRIAVRKFVSDIPMSRRHPSWNVLEKTEQELCLLAHKQALLLWGAEDFCFTEPFLRNWEEFLPKSKTEIMEDCGHYVLEDAKYDAIDKIHSFIVKSKVPDVTLYK